MELLEGRLKKRISRSFLAMLVGIGATAVSARQAQQPAPPPNPEFERIRQASAEDHRQTMEQLGIRVLRPGPSGNEAAPNHANYDEALANPFPKLPELLTLDNGKKVTPAADWWKLRRPEIVEQFEREIVGRIPAHVPKVTWSIKESVTGLVGGLPVNGRHVVGRADNASHPAIAVEIR